MHVFICVFSICVWFIWIYWYRLFLCFRLCVFFNAMTVPLWSLPLKGIPRLGIRYFSDQPLHTSREWSNGKFLLERWIESIELAWDPQWVKWRKFWMFFVFRFVLCLKQFVKYGCRNWFQVDIYIHYAMHHLNIITSYNFSIIWVKLWERAKICVKSCHTSLAVKSLNGDIPKDPWDTETVEVHILSLKWSLSNVSFPSTKMPVKT